ncbi:MAG: hypothetical protein ABIJ85_01080 [bacterium]
MNIEDIRTLPLGQIEFIVKLHESLNRRNFAEGKHQGTYSKQLHEKGWIIPSGLIKRRVRWELVKKFNPSEIKLMKDLLK